MRVLLIKTSSMGDIIHTLPALTDAGRALPGMQFDWIVEESFADIPRWHPLVDQVIPIHIRRWRKNIFSTETRLALLELKAQLAEQTYDYILDAQGLTKTAWLGFLAQGVRVGLSFSSVRERLAALAYQKRCTVNFKQHAIVRMRSLFSQALGYRLADDAADFSLDLSQFKHGGKVITSDALVAHCQSPYVVFLHGTTWVSKQWPEAYWKMLAELAAQAGYRIKITAGNQEEEKRAQRIAFNNAAVDVLPYLDVASVAGLLAYAKAVVAVDTGFGHLAAALGVPTFSLYGSTDAQLTGAIGTASSHLVASFPCAPCLKRFCSYRGHALVQPACFEALSPQKIWDALSL